MSSVPTAARLRELFDYDPETGVFVRHRLPSRRADRSKGDGYSRIYVEGKKQLAHRAAWAIFYGEWPPDEIDHRNMVKSDNRIKNLRLATHAQNVKNTKPMRALPKGVAKTASGNWQAQIKADDKYYYLGSFKDIEHAAACYRIAAAAMHGEFARTA